MDKFPAALLMVASACFWSVILLVQMAVPTPVEVFNIFLYGSAVFGVISLYGCITVMRELKVRSLRWYLGIPMATVLAGGAFCACGFVVAHLASLVHLLDPMIAGFPVGMGLFFLPAAGLCAFLLLLALFPLEENRVLSWCMLVIGLICAMYSFLYLALVGGSIICSILQLPQPAVEPVIFGSGDSSVWRIVVYCTAGLPFIGLLLLIHAYRIGQRQENME